MTIFEPQTVGGTTPNSGSHSAATTVLNTGIEVKRNVQSLDDAELSIPGPIAVRRFFRVLPTTPR